MKAKLLTVLVTLISCLLLISSGIIIHLLKSPLSNIDNDDVYSVMMLDTFNGKTLYTFTEDEQLEIIETLNSIDIPLKSTEEHKNYDGTAAFMYRLVKGNGEHVYFAANSPFLTINGKGYKCGSEPLQKLNDIYLKHYQRISNSTTD